MTEDDAEDIRLLRARIKRAKDRAAKWRQRARSADATHGTNYYDNQIRLAGEAVIKWQNAIAMIEKESEMRKAVVENAPAGMTPPHEGWTLRTKKTLNLGGRVVGPGTEISTTDLAQMANASVLISGGYIAWSPPQTSRPHVEMRSPQASVSVDVALSDPISECRSALRKMAAQRHITKREALDVIDQSLVQRAIKQYADLPKTVLTGSWGSGLLTMQRSGVGTLRRITDGFEDFICSDEREKEAA